LVVSFMVMVPFSSGRRPVGSVGHRAPPLSRTLPSLNGSEASYVFTLVFAR
jgi:hypothetical protein